MPIAEPTANLGPPSVDFDNELESRQLTLHAFGHVLGLIHEYQTPAAASQVNLDKAFTYFSGPPNRWTREMVEANYRPLKNAGGLYADKPFDPVFGDAAQTAGRRHELWQDLQSRRPAVARRHRLRSQAVSRPLRWR